MDLYVYTHWYILGKISKRLLVKNLRFEFSFSSEILTISGPKIDGQCGQSDVIVLAKLFRCLQLSLIYFLKKLGPRFDSPFLDLIYLGTRLRPIYLFLKLDEITTNMSCGMSYKCYGGQCYVAISIIVVRGQMCIISREIVALCIESVFKRLNFPRNDSRCVWLLYLKHRDKVNRLETFPYR